MKIRENQTLPICAGGERVAFEIGCGAASAAVGGNLRIDRLIFFVR